MQSESNEEKPVLKCDNIIVSARGIAETDGKKVAIFVSADEIDHLTLKFGRSAHNMVLSLLIGVVFALAGFWGLFKLFVAPRGFRYELGAVAFGIVGGSIIFDTLKERYFLELNKKKDTCRLVFSKKARKQEVEEFCNRVRTEYKYEIRDEV